jgi:histidinol dehydrogenase
MANELAPEHLEVLLKNPLEYVGKLDNAGSMFLGQYSPEPLGDYFAGPNHVLPTSGTARFFSPLSVNSFTKRTSFIYYTEQALLDAKTDIVTIAEKEGLTVNHLGTDIIWYTIPMNYFREMIAVLKMWVLD